MMACHVKKVGQLDYRSACFQYSKAARYLRLIIVAMVNNPCPLQEMLLLPFESTGPMIHHLNRAPQQCCALGLPLRQADEQPTRKGSSGAAGRVMRQINYVTGEGAAYNVGKINQESLGICIYPLQTTAPNSMQPWRNPVMGSSISSISTDAPFSLGPIPQ